MRFTSYLYEKYSFLTTHKSNLKKDYKYFYT